MTTARPDLAEPPLFLSSADLRAAGATRKSIARDVAQGRVVRLRRDVYVAPDADPLCGAAARLFGRVACVSELRRRGIFVLERAGLHVHVPRTSSRLPSGPSSVHRHRSRLHRMPHPQAMAVEAFDAVAQAVRCQDPRSAVATLDSALHHGLLRLDELDELFAALPRRYRRLRGLLDPRAESGPETFVRLMLRSLGCRVDLQVVVDGVGRVDLLVEGWLIVECDSEAWHGDAVARRRDRVRDLEAHRRGYIVARFDAQDILWRPEAVSEALRRLLHARRLSRGV